MSIFLASFLYLNQYVDQTPFHRDEARWIHRVYYLKLWKDPLSDLWQDEGYTAHYGSWDEIYRMRDQPPMASYILGVGLLLQGRDLDVNGFWVMDKDDAWNIARGHAPSEADLLAARRTNAFLAAATASVMFFLGLWVSNRAGGIITGLVQGFHPLVTDTSTRAWGDAALVLFLALAALAIFQWGSRPTWLRAITIGILLGLGASAKLSPLLLSVPIALLGFCLLGIHLLRGGKTDFQSRGRQLVIVPIVSLATFIASYPYLWRDPVTHVLRLYQFRLDSFKSQGNMFPQARVTGFPDAMRRVGGELGSSFNVSGLLAREFSDLTGLEWPAWVGAPSWDLALTVLGVLLLAGHLIWRWGFLNGRSLSAIFLIGQSALVILGMGVEYARYLLPLTLLISFCIGLVLAQSGRVIRHALVCAKTRRRQHGHARATSSPAHRPFSF